MAEIPQFASLVVLLRCNCAARLAVIYSALDYCISPRRRPIVRSGYGAPLLLACATSPRRIAHRHYRNASFPTPLWVQVVPECARVGSSLMHQTRSCAELDQHYLADLAYRTLRRPKGHALVMLDES